MATYFVRSDGADTCDGTTDQSAVQNAVHGAWKTVGKVNGYAFSAGDIIQFRGGDTFRDAGLSNSSVGTAQSPITFQSYGTGRATIRGSKDFSGLTWSVYSGSVYQSTSVAGLPVTCLMAWLDSITPLTKAASLGAMVAGTFWISGTTLYVWTPTGVSPANPHTLEIANLKVNLVTLGKNYQTLNNMCVQHAQYTAAVMVLGSTLLGGVVTHCSVGYCVKAGIYSCTSGGSVDHNIVYDCWDQVLYPGGLANGYGIVLSTGCINTPVYSNWIQNCYLGIRGLNSHQSPAIHHNIVLWSKVNSIDMTGGTAGLAPAIYNNFVWHRPNTGSGHGIDIQSGTASSGIDIRNNIVYSDYNTAAPTNLELICLDQTNYAPVTVNNNCYWTSADYTASFGKLASNLYATFATWKTALNGTSYTGKDASSVNSDPLLASLSAANPDFHIAFGSPCAGGGVNLSLTQDYDGAVVPSAKGYSIGAYEPYGGNQLDAPYYLSP